MKKKIEKYIPRIKKYVFIALIAVTLANLALWVYFQFNTFEFRTTGYKIKGYVVYFMMYLLLFWLWYGAYKFCKQLEYEVYNWWQMVWKICAFLLMIGCVLLSIPIVLFIIMDAMFGNLYDECMERCVAEDLSNYNECALTMCD